MNKLRVLILICLLYNFKILAQTGITTAVPFLLITPDARAGSMGDVGVATSADAFSIFHNPAKIAFSDRQIKTGVTYSPWLRKLANDIFIGTLSYINRYDENSAWGAEFRYFSLGRVELTTSDGNPNGSINPNEFIFTGTYALKLSETYSMGIGLKYLRSNLTFSGIPGSAIQPINSFAVDISGYYQSSEENYGSFNGLYRFGFNITNIGPKVTYTPGTGSEEFIPTNLKLGGGFDFILDDFNTISTTLEFTKLLVPTDPSSEAGWVEGIFNSFGDAPGGFSEEMKEITYAFGAEYLYNNTFSLRTGYFHQSEDKGNIQYFTIGAGFKTNALNIDISYLINSSEIGNPLENTLRFSLSFDLGEVIDVF